MVIRKKIESVIERGGSHSQEAEKSPEWRILCQKVREDVLREVDKAVADRPGMNRSAWIQEAISDKLKFIKMEEL